MQGHRSPISLKKTTAPSTSTVFLGVELDSIRQCSKLPQEKLSEYSQNIKNILHKRTITKRNLQSVIGKLSFSAAVIPARAFLRRLINQLPHASKQHHFITLKQDSRLDLKVWYYFMKHYNGITFFRSLNILDSFTINMCSDACKDGFGATYKHRWIQGKYPESWSSLNIVTLELYPIYIMLSLFGTYIQNSTVNFLCDNQSVCYILNKLTCKDNFTMDIIRSLVLSLIKNNIHIIANHIPGKYNTICDRISRFQITASDLELACMDPLQTTIPLTLLPEQFTIQCNQIYAIH